MTSTTLARGEHHLSPVVALAELVADALEFSSGKSAGSDVQKLTQDLLRTVEEVDQGVSIAASAELLELSVPTVHEWIKREVLEVIEGTSPAQISVGSLGVTLRAVRVIRSKGDKGRLLAHVEQELQDRRLLASLQSEIDDSAAGRITYVHPDDVGSLFSE